MTKDEAIQELRGVQDILTSEIERICTLAPASMYWTAVVLGLTDAVTALEQRITSTNGDLVYVDLREA